MGYRKIIMKTVVLTCLLIGLSACAKPHFITNAEQKNDIGFCMVLSDKQPNNDHVWHYYYFYPNKKSDFIYFFKISDYFQISENCQKEKLVFNEIDVSINSKSTGGSKGEAVGVFNFNIDVNFIRENQEVLRKTYTLETRSQPYNWNLQKTIRGYHAQAFTEGMMKIQDMIEADWHHLERNSF